MSSPIKAITYSELAYVLSAPDMQADFNDACQNLALSLLNHMDAFENVAKPLHSVDILGVAPSFKQKWAVLAKVCQFVLPTMHQSPSSDFIRALRTCYGIFA